MHTAARCRHGEARGHHLPHLYLWCTLGYPSRSFPGVERVLQRGRISLALHSLSWGRSIVLPCKVNPMQGPTSCLKVLVGILKGWWHNLLSFWEWELSSRGIVRLECCSNSRERRAGRERMNCSRWGVHVRSIHGSRAYAVINYESLCRMDGSWDTIDLQSKQQRKRSMSLWPDLCFSAVTLRLLQIASTLHFTCWRP